MSQNIYAFTEPGGMSPAYISINRQEGDRLSIAVRSSGSPHVQAITLESAQVDALIDSLKNMEREP